MHRGFAFVTRSALSAPKPLWIELVSYEKLVASINVRMLPPLQTDKPLLVSGTFPGTTCETFLKLM